ncbi:hypothetical protein B0H13DRAFT_1870285 [Mycena leptocephala]|nr:hypothetical protein B0H13DRAFT_1870285 [Mycena leptocephala]
MWLPKGRRRTARRMSLAILGEVGVLEAPAQEAGVQVVAALTAVARRRGRKKGLLEDKLTPDIWLFEGAVPSLQSFRKRSKATFGSFAAVFTFLFFPRLASGYIAQIFCGHLVTPHKPTQAIVFKVYGEDDLGDLLREMSAYARLSHLTITPKLLGAFFSLQGNAWIGTGLLLENTGVQVGSGDSWKDLMFYQSPGIVALLAAGQLEERNKPPAFDP